MEADLKDVNYLFPADTKVIHFSGSPDKYTALLRSKCRSKEEFREKWLKQYEKISRVAMRVLLTRPKTGKIVVYKAAFRCQHNTYPASHQRVKAPHRKHTGCPAILKVTIKASPEDRRVRSIDTLRREYPTIISINHDHNHRLPTPTILTTSNILEVNCEGIQTAWVKEEPGLEEAKPTLLPPVEELDWDFLKQCWTSFMEKWESSNSVHLYRALFKATNCLENCKTVNATIAALNSIGKKLNKKRCDSKVLIQPTSLSSTKLICNGLSEKQETKPEVSNAVDELLVIDQGWII